MDGYVLAREDGAALADWQARYPQFSDSLAEFEAFLRIDEQTPEPELSQEEERNLIERARHVANQVLARK
jgi:hypothetical protein